MTKRQANLIHALVQIFLSFWIYYDAVNQGIHQLFPLAMGIILLSLNNGIMFNNKAQVNAAIFITIASLLFLAKMSWETLSVENYREGVFYAIMVFTAMMSTITLIAQRKVKTN
ncbi:MAG: hypothetical protein LC107_03250 [Chitinophagales bacterium]|nr:hypothetical protein [Chitinophagales bacterium]